MMFRWCTWYRLLEGGADTGFHHVEPESYTPRLMHFAGAGRNVVIRQVFTARLLLRPPEGCKILWWYVCLNGRLHISETTQPNFTKFLCMLRVAVEPEIDWFKTGPLTLFSSGIVVYFRFCGWRHAFTKWAPWCVVGRERNSRNSYTLFPTWRFSRSLYSRIHHCLAARLQSHRILLNNRFRCTPSVLRNR